jgi:cobalt-precorrin 5A hydrolase
MIVAGVGCRKDVPAAAISAAIDMSLAGAGLARDRLGAIATAAAKQNEPGLVETAVAFGVPLIAVEQTALEAASQHAVTRSERVMALTGVPSVAEAAAIAAAGPGARLVARRTALGPVTCALAQSGEAS